MFAANNQNKITTEKGPVMLLYELFTDISFNCVQTVGPQHAKFKTLVTVNGLNQFEGTGKSFYILFIAWFVFNSQFDLRAVQEVIQKCCCQSGIGIFVQHLV